MDSDDGLTDGFRSGQGPLISTSGIPASHSTLTSTSVSPATNSTRTSLGPADSISAVKPMPGMAPLRLMSSPTHVIVTVPPSEAKENGPISLAVVLVVGSTVVVVVSATVVAVVEPTVVGVVAMLVADVTVVAVIVVVDDAVVGGAVVEAIDAPVVVEGSVVPADEDTANVNDGDGSSAVVAPTRSTAATEAAVARVVTASQAAT